METTDYCDYLTMQSLCLNGLFNKHLAQRLTAEEKEQIRFAHKAAKTFAERTNPMSAEVFKGQYLLLESIFGKDFFKEENI